MQIINITNREQLDEFVGAEKHSQFLQSYEWGEFQEKVGNKIIRVGVEDNGKIIAAATLIKKTLPMGKSYFYCPRGPIGQTARQLDTRQLEFLFNEVEKIAKKEDAIFLRFEPANNLRMKNEEFRIINTIDVQPSKTLILNLEKSEDGLLKQMHQKTRYNIRLAEKKGVKIVEAQNFAIYFENFWQLMRETVVRDNFRLHGKDYYQKMLEVNFIKLYLAEFEGKVIAGSIMAFFGDTVTYLHGASSNQYRNVMAPYLLQWHGLKLAKEMGYKYYDFFGIDEKKWPGVTRFKKGFGGQEIKYPGTFDLVFENGWYRIYKVFRTLRRRI
ncbi:MAG: peptidoglycan bridge formation glycyltransferase FemA/FemB family protein [Patescibacteria group bacterium]